MQKKSLQVFVIQHELKEEEERKYQLLFCLLLVIIFILSYLLYWELHVIHELQTTWLLEQHRLLIDLIAIKEAEVSLEQEEQNILFRYRIKYLSDCISLLITLYRIIKK
jgi:hypothetical protein